MIRFGLLFNDSYCSSGPELEIICWIWVATVRIHPALEITRMPCIMHVRAQLHVRALRAYTIMYKLIASAVEQASPRYVVASKCCNPDSWSTCLSTAPTTPRFRGFSPMQPQTLGT